MRLRQQYGGYDEDSDDGDDSDHGKTMKMNMKKKNMIMEIMNHNDLRMRMQDVHGDDEDWWDWRDTARLWCIQNNTPQMEAVQGKKHRKQEGKLMKIVGNNWQQPLWTANR